MHFPCAHLIITIAFVTSFYVFPQRYINDIYDLIQLLDYLDIHFIFNDTCQLLGIKETSYKCTAIILSASI